MLIHAPFDRDRPIDLHVHSAVSDGTESPGDVVRQAARAGLGTVALTDHDTISGWGEAAIVAREEGLTLVPGVEFSAQIGPGSVHVLGYLPDPANEELIAEMDRTRVERLTRAELMVERIAADYELSWDDVLSHSEPGATIGRPHIADALVSKGIVADRSAAFESILHWQGGYYRPHIAPTPKRAVELIRAAGGVPVLAHPATRGRHGMTDTAITELVEAGLLGLEVEHREHDESAKERLRQIAEAHDLIVTGSSDYHGTGKPNRLGEHTTEPAQLDRILALASGSEPIYPD